MQLPEMNEVRSAALRWRLSWPVVYAVALVTGVLVAAGSLAYEPLGRINVIPLVVLWGGLPLLGSLFALVWVVRGGRVPWLAYAGPLHSLPAAAIWATGARLQWAWAGFALGVLGSFLGHLALTDLAFGWSSTLVGSASVIAASVDVLSVPWAAWWPQAVPGAEVIATTRHERIAPAAAGASGAGWWPFLAAVIVVYSLLPRVALGVVCTLLARRGARGRGSGLVARSPTLSATEPDRSAPTLRRETAANWSAAFRIYWQQTAPAEPETGLIALGLGDWQSDQARLNNALRYLRSTRRVLWLVPLVQTPVAELSDLIQVVEHTGCQQGIAVSGYAGAEGRFLLSWQAFARRHELVWVGCREAADEA